MVIVGLGNPGSTYARTRHNIGFLVVERLIHQFGLTALPNQFDALIAEGTIEGFTVLAVQPLTYMNRSGGPVSAVLTSRGIPCEDLVVIHDDIDLAYERLKIKEKGGDGGHNGLRSLIDALGTNRFSRVRMGVGRPEDNIGVVEYVLGEFDLNQRIVLDSFLSRAVEATLAILCNGAKEAMNRFNRKP